MAKRPTQDPVPQQADDKEIQSLDSVLAKINTTSCRAVRQVTTKQCLKQGAQCYWFKQVVTTYECCDAANCWTITVSSPPVKGGKCECGARPAASAMSLGCGCC